MVVGDCTQFVPEFVEGDGQEEQEGVEVASIKVVLAVVVQTESVAETLYVVPGEAPPVNPVNTAGGPAVVGAFIDGETSVSVDTDPLWPE